jgi:DNA mismatch repair protein MSH4
MTYKEAMEDAYQHATELNRKSVSSVLQLENSQSIEEYDILLDLKYEAARHFFIRISAAELETRPLPPVFTNVIRKKNNIECQTVELMKRNQKVSRAVS